MINVITLPWSIENRRYVARTIYGKVELIALQEPSTSAWSIRNPLGKPRLGWGIYLKGLRISWVLDLKDAAHFATAHITQLANKARGLK